MFWEYFDAFIPTCADSDTVLDTWVLVSSPNPAGVMWLWHNWWAVALVCSVLQVFVNTMYVGELDYNTVELSIPEGQVTIGNCSVWIAGSPEREKSHKGTSS